MSITIDLRSEAREVMPRVPELPALAAAARATWRARMINEYASHVVFAALAEQLRAAGFDVDTIRTCAGFAEEEKQHGILCGAVVEALGGEAVATLPDARPFPVHADVGAKEAVIRNVLSISCLSETVAVSLIGAERIEMPGGELKALLSRIWADEIGHARFGWKLVSELAPDLDGAARTRLGQYLAIAFAHLESHELAHLPAACRPPAEGVRLGLCSGADARVLFYETVEEIIVPHLEALGLPALAAWRSRARLRLAS